MRRILSYFFMFCTALIGCGLLYHLINTLGIDYWVLIMIPFITSAIICAIGLGVVKDKRCGESDFYEVMLAFSAGVIFLCGAWAFYLYPGDSKGLMGLLQAVTGDMFAVGFFLLLGLLMVCGAISQIHQIFTLKHR